MAATTMWETTGSTHHVQKHDDAEVDAHCRSGGGHLRVIPDEGPVEGCKRANRHHAINHYAEDGGDHHQNLGRERAEGTTE